MKRIISRASLLLFVAALPVVAQEWTRFRGPNGAGVSDARGIPTQWSGHDINWKVSLPGSGHSSPVVWGEKIFLMSTDEQAGKNLILCVRADDGSIAWRQDLAFAPFQKHKFNSFASSTPTVDAEKVYVCWSTPAQFMVAAFDHDGKKIWDRDIGPFVSQHGSGASPVLFDGKIILPNEQEGQSFLIALDAKTGKTRWQTSRSSVSTTYSTPCVYQPKGQKPVLIFNSQAHGIYAVDPETGNVAWEYTKAFDKRSVSSPIVAGDLIFGSCGSGGGGNYVVAVRAGDRASGKAPELAYELRRSAPYVPTGVVDGVLVFLWGDGGIVTCLHAPTGAVQWQERVGGNFFGSPVLVEKRIFCVSSSGEVVVIEASDRFQVLARNPLDETTHTTPAVAGGRMYVRTLSHLISVGGKAAAGE